MAVGSFDLYTAAGLGLGSGSFNLGTNTFVCILVTNTYVPNFNTDSTYSNVSANELATGSGYTAGGVVLGGQTWTTSTATNTFAAYSASWAGPCTFSCRYGVVVRRAGASLVAGDLLLGAIDLTGAGNVTAGGSVFQINWNNASTTSAASTLFTLTHTP